MRDSQHDGQNDRFGGGLSVLARTVVARMAAREAAMSFTGPRKTDDALVAALARAVISDDAAPLQALLPDLRRARISEIDLVDSYFPEVARYLGCAWAEDRSPFTDVTVGVARMQAILRQVGRGWTSNDVARLESGTVLLVLPEAEQHTFGAIVLAGQLRRQGISVRLEIGPTPAAIGALVRQKSFDCAMISVGCEEKLDPCRRLVRALKDGSSGGLRVAVGGAVLERSVDVPGCTGADIVTNDPALALAGAPMRVAPPISGNI